jgi:putative ABC transport system permease protein
MISTIEPGYFQALGLTLVLGESFSDRHGAPGQEAAIVNRRFVERYLGAANPIGRRIALIPRPQLGSEAPLTIVGVSPDIRQGQRDVQPMIYIPYRAQAPAGVTLMVRGPGGSARVLSLAREEVHAIDPDLALGLMKPLDELRDAARLPSNMLTSQFIAFAVVALLLAGVGLYSVMAYAVARRTQEIALRMALGARPAAVGWLFLRTSAWVVTGGLLLGLPLSVAAGQLLEANLLYTHASDPATLAVVTGTLLAIALAAAIVPVRRAVRVEPTDALRVE